MQFKVPGDMEGGWAYPILRLHPDAQLTKRLCRELENTQKFISQIERAKHQKICFAFVLNGLISGKIQKKVREYTLIWQQYTVLACRLFDLTGVCNWLIENSQVLIGYHSFDHTSFEYIKSSEFKKNLENAEKHINRLNKEYNSNRFVRLMVFPMNILPQYQLCSIENWTFRIGRTRNPQTASNLKNFFNYFLADYRDKNCICTQTYYPLATGLKSTFLRQIQFWRRRFWLSKFIWIHAWELDDKYF